MSIVFLKFFSLLAGSLLSGLLYRLGGWGGPGRVKCPNLPGWFFDTKARDIGCAIVGFSMMKFTLGIIAPWWIHLISFILLFGALTTYWDELFGYDNHYFHGAMCAAAYLPYCFYGDPLAIGLRVLVCGLLMGAWSKLIGKDWVEEGGRGFILIFTLNL